MSEEELKNWQRIKDTLEYNRKTDNWFYTRAVAICAGEPDPLELKQKDKS
jgi:hypothetical protein